MAYKIKNKGRTAYRINIKGQIFQARSKKELLNKLDKAENQEKILWFSKM